LTGLTDDDHSQYHTDARGDARYAATGHNHTAASVSFAPAGTIEATNVQAAIEEVSNSQSPDANYVTAIYLGALI